MLALLVFESSGNAKPISPRALTNTVPVFLLPQLLQLALTSPEANLNPLAQHARGVLYQQCVPSSFCL